MRRREHLALGALIPAVSALINETRTGYEFSVAGFNQSGGGHSRPNWLVSLSKYAPLLSRD